LPFCAGHAPHIGSARELWSMVLVAGRRRDPVTAVPDGRRRSCRNRGRAPAVRGRPGRRWRRAAQRRERRRP
jgi:hypothetical protein